MKRLALWFLCITAVCAVCLTGCASKQAVPDGTDGAGASNGENVRQDAAQQQEQDRVAALEAQYGVTGLDGWEPGPLRNSIQKTGGTATMNIVPAVEYHDDLRAFAQTFYDIYVNDQMGRDMSEIKPVTVADTQGYSFTLIDLSGPQERHTALYVYNKNSKTYLATGQADTREDLEAADFPAAIAAYSYEKGTKQ